LGEEEDELGEEEDELGENAEALDKGRVIFASSQK